MVAAHRSRRDRDRGPALRSGQQVARTGRPASAPATTPGAGRSHLADARRPSGVPLSPAARVELDGVSGVRRGRVAPRLRPLLLRPHVRGRSSVQEGRRDRPPVAEPGTGRTSLRHRQHLQQLRDRPLGRTSPFAGTTGRGTLPSQNLFPVSAVVFGSGPEELVDLGLVPERHHGVALSVVDQPHSRGRGRGARPRDRAGLGPCRPVRTLGGAAGSGATCCPGTGAGWRRTGASTSRELTMAFHMTWHTWATPGTRGPMRCAGDHAMLLP